MNNISEQCDIVLHFDKNVDLQVKLACKEFRKWLKSNGYVSSIVQVYIKSSEKVKTKEKKSAVGIFGTPVFKYPYIKISTGDFQSLKYKQGSYSALMSILHSFAHEIVHYNQWIKNKPYKESEANRNGKIMVEKYSEFKNGILIASKKELEFIDKGDRCYDDENYARAIKYYNKVISLNPYLDCIFKDMGDLYGLLNKHKEAIDYYDKAIELNQQNYDAYLNKGYALLYTNRYEEALDYFNKVIAIDSGNEDAFIFKAQTLEALSKFGEALNCYDMALKINSENKITYNGKARIFYMLKEYEKSIILYNKSITIDPEYAEAYYNRAISCIALNNIENCLVSLKKAIKIDNRYKDYAIEEKYFDSINNLESILNQ